MREWVDSGYCCMWKLSFQTNEFVLCAKEAEKMLKSFSTVDILEIGGGSDRLYVPAFL